MKAAIAHIYRYPVKGLSADSLRKALLQPGAGIPGDRRYAIVRGGTLSLSLPGVRLTENQFVTLANTPRLALLTTRWIDGATTLTVERDGRQVAWADLSTVVGRARISDFFAAFLGDHGQPEAGIIELGDELSGLAGGTMVTVVSESSLHDLERVAGHSLDMRRFRPNLVLSGLPAWAELSMIGNEIATGRGLRLRLVQPAECRASANVDPDLGIVDVNLVRSLQRGFGHSSFGVLAEVVAGGVLEAGGKVSIPASPVA